MSAHNLVLDTTLPEHINTMQDAVVIDGVSKIFTQSRPLVHWPGKRQEVKEQKREVRAVDNVSLVVKRHEIVGILGSNVSGKSTLIRILSTLRIPVSGHVLIFGYEFEGKRHDAGDKLGFLKATVEMALARQDLGGPFRTYLKSLNL